LVTGYGDVTEERKTTVIGNSTVNRSPTMNGNPTVKATVNGGAMVNGKAPVIANWRSIGATQGVGQVGVVTAVVYCIKSRGVRFPEDIEPGVCMCGSSEGNTCPRSLRSDSGFGVGTGFIN
jgi:hypothetical protein